ncbi:disintegrin and metalloproteinase domain-containing protein 18-like [Tetranychus urticae]|nr:disintegrin and metalloproteinase domain-containing protein 18-like [Tetranychus urticae]
MLVDYHTYLHYSQNITTCKQIAREIVNGAAYYMKMHNVFISLVETIVWTTEHGSISNTHPGIELNNIRVYKSTNEPFTSIYSNYTLVFLSNSPNNTTIGGGAALSGACARDSSAIILKLDSSIAIMGSILAHEIGHQLSMEHDDKGYCPCPYNWCIMNPYGANNPAHVMGWTNCSFAYFNYFKKIALSQCLTIPPSEAAPSYCGDGIVHSNEECDCGPSSTGCGPCCNPQTCTLTSNAVCGSGPCCNLTTCNYIEASYETICRQSTDSNCDFVEYCDGQSQFCPEDKTVHDGVRCALDGFCFKGKCGSPDAHCSYLNQGSAKRGSLLCFHTNFMVKGLHPCGVNRTNSGVLCDYADIECGRLACDPNMTHEVTYVAAFYHTSKWQIFYYTTREPIGCVTFDFVDLIPKNAGYAPNGAVCGFDYLGICIDTKCIPVNQIINENACPGNCNGYGICDNFGQCHCDPGINTTDCS